MMRSDFLDASKSENAPNLSVGEDPEMLNPEIPDASSRSMPFQLYKTQTTILVSREKFLNVACDALSAYKYVGPNQKADLLLACSCLCWREAGEQLYDHNTKTVSVVDEEYRNQRAANTLGSKGMFQFIQRKGSSRNLMALFNPDGSVTKAWHVDSSNSNGNGIRSSDKSARNPMVNPSQIGKAESVNLQFRSFGISVWLSDTGGTRNPMGRRSQLISSLVLSGSACGSVIQVAPATLEA